MLSSTVIVMVRLEKLVSASMTANSVKLIMVTENTGDLSDARLGILEYSTLKNRYFKSILSLSEINIIFVIGVQQ